MNNNKVLWGILALVIIVAFVYFVSASKDEPLDTEIDLVDSSASTTQETQPTTETKPAAPTSPKPTVTTPTTKTGVAKNFLTVNEAVNSGLSIKCVSVLGGVTNTYFIANGKVRRDSASLSGVAHTTVRPDAIFTWNGNSTNETDYTGTLAGTARVDVMSTSLKNVSCLTASIPDSTFARP